MKSPIVTSDLFSEGRIPTTPREEKLGFFETSFFRSGLSISGIFFVDPFSGQGSILPNFDFFNFQIFFVQLECL
jgi:hypothetical protein